MNLIQFFHVGEWCVVIFEICSKVVWTFFEICLAIMTESFRRELESYVERDREEKEIKSLIIGKFKL